MPANKPRKNYAKNKTCGSKAGGAKSKPETEETKKTLLDDGRTTLWASCDRKEEAKKAADLFAVTYMKGDEEWKADEWKQKLRSILKVELDFSRIDGDTAEAVLDSLINDVKAADLEIERVIGDLQSLDDDELNEYLLDVVRLHNSIIKRTSESESDAESDTESEVDRKEKIRDWNDLRAIINDVKVRWRDNQSIPIARGILNGSIPRIPDLRVVGAQEKMKKLESGDYNGYKLSVDITKHSNTFVSSGKTNTNAFREHYKAISKMSGKELRRIADQTIHSSIERKKQRRLERLSLKKAADVTEANDSDDDWQYDVVNELFANAPDNLNSDEERNGDSDLEAEDKRCAKCGYENPARKLACVKCNEDLGGVDTKWDPARRAKLGIYNNQAVWHCNVCYLQNLSHTPRCTACKRPKPTEVDSSNGNLMKPSISTGGDENTKNSVEATGLSDSVSKSINERSTAGDDGAKTLVDTTGLFGAVSKSNDTKSTAGDDGTMTPLDTTLLSGTVSESNDTKSAGGDDGTKTPVDTTGLFGTGIVSVDTTGLSTTSVMTGTRDAAFGSTAGIPAPASLIAPVGDMAGITSNGFFFGGASAFGETGSSGATGAVSESHDAKSTGGDDDTKTLVDTARPDTASESESTGSQLPGRPAPDTTGFDGNNGKKKASLSTVVEGEKDKEEEEEEEDLELAARLAVFEAKSKANAIACACDAKKAQISELNREQVVLAAEQFASAAEAAVGEGAKTIAHLDNMKKSQEEFAEQMDELEDLQAKTPGKHRKRKVSKMILSVTKQRNEDMVEVQNQALTLSVQRKRKVAFGTPGPTANGMACSPNKLRFSSHK